MKYAVGGLANELSKILKEPIMKKQLLILFLVIFFTANVFALKGRVWYRRHGRKSLRPDREVYDG